MKFEVEVIPLYKFTARFESGDGKGCDWEWVVVSDTLYGIAEKIINRCINSDDLKNCRKELCVTDFIKMRCDGLNGGFHLLDIDEYDCHGYGGYAMIDEQYVETSFGDGEPVPVPELVTEDMLSEAYLESGEAYRGSGLEYYCMYDALGEEIYRVAVESELFRRVRGERDSSDRREKHIAAKMIREITKESLI